MSNTPYTEKVLSTLKAHYTAPMRQSFQQFKLGAMLFFTGFVGLYIAQTAVSDSLQQELLALGGIVMAGLGFLIAMLAQIRMLISRLLNFYLDKPPLPGQEPSQES